MAMRSHKVREVAFRNSVNYEKSCSSKIDTQVYTGHRRRAHAHAADPLMQVRDRGTWNWGPLKALGFKRCLIENDNIVGAAMPPQLEGC